MKCQLFKFKTYYLKILTATVLATTLTPGPGVAQMVHVGAFEQEDINTDMKLRQRHTWIEDESMIIKSGKNPTISNAYTPAEIKDISESRKWIGKKLQNTACDVNLCFEEIKRVLVYAKVIRVVKPEQVQPIEFFKYRVNIHLDTNDIITAVTIG